MPRTYYEVLGVHPTATDAELRSSYLKLSLKHHPDKNPDKPEEAERRFVEIATAYETLRDPVSRRQYDEELRHPRAQASPRAQPHSQTPGGDWGQPGSRPPPQQRDRAYSLFEKVVRGAAAASGTVVLGGAGPAGGRQAGALASSLVGSMAAGAAGRQGGDFLLRTAAAVVAREVFNAVGTAEARANTRATCLQIADSAGSTVTSIAAATGDTVMKPAARIVTNAAEVGASVAAVAGSAVTSTIGAVTTVGAALNAPAVTLGAAAAQGSASGVALARRGLSAWATAVTAVTGHFWTTLHIINQTPWPAQLVFQVTDPQPTEWRSVVYVPPEGPDVSAAPPPVIVPLRRSGIGKRRVPVVVTYAVTPSTDVRLCFRVAVPPEDREDQVALQPSCVLFNDLPRGEVMRDDPEQIRAAVTFTFEEALAQAMDGEQPLPLSARPDAGS